MAMSGTTATLLARRMVRKEDAKIVFVLRDGKYYLAEFLVRIRLLLGNCCD
jgi:hypothetical protein